jgi:signal transduction histidine kinase
MGFAYLLQQNPATPEAIKEDIEAIYEESKRASEVIQNFLLFTRGQQTEKIVIQINDVVEAALSLRQSRLELENIKVDKHLAEGLPSIQGNAAQLQQALVNIVLNAEHFMYQAHQRGTLEVTTTVSGANVKVIINDDGPGIAPDKLGRVFEPFYSTRESGEGTGLGLSVCHGIIKEHGGNIYAESAPGRGATFTVELPAGQQGFILA